MTTRLSFLLITCAILAILGCNSGNSESEAELVLINGKIWTGDPDNPWASWIAVDGERITAIGTNGNSAPNGERVIDLEGRLTLPGFNDSHVHFASAGALLLGINLLDVNDEEGLRRNMQAAAERLPKGSWITRGDWGAYEAWGVGSDGSESGKTLFTPHREMIDAITPDHPVLINRYDRTEGLANALALEILGLESETGLLTGAEFREALEQIPGKVFRAKTGGVTSSTCGVCQIRRDDRSGHVTS